MSKSKTFLSDEEILKGWKKAKSIFTLHAQQSSLQVQDQSSSNDAGEQVSLSEALTQAADLVDDMQNHEYTRGVCELIARLYPLDDVCTSLRAQWVEQAIKQTIQGKCPSTH